MQNRRPSPIPKEIEIALVGQMLDHARLLRAGRMKLAHSDASPSSPKIGIAAGLVLMTPTGQGVIVGAVSAEIDQILHHESRAAMQNRRHTFQIARIESEFHALDPPSDVFVYDGPNCVPCCARACRPETSRYRRADLSWRIVLNARAFVRDHTHA